MADSGIRLWLTAYYYNVTASCDEHIGTRQEVSHAGHQVLHE